MPDCIGSEYAVNNSKLLSLQNMRKEVTQKVITKQMKGYFQLERVSISVLSLPWCIIQKFKINLLFFYVPLVVPKTTWHEKNSNLQKGWY